MKKINLDIIRIILALMIVAIHVYPLSSYSETLDYFFTRVIFRIAVPMFLMITGFYVLPKALENKEKLKKYTKKILKIYLISIIIYLPVNIYKGTYNNILFLNIIKDIFITGSFYHLWYFPALILGIWLTYYLLKKVKKPYNFIIIFILYIIGLFGDSYYRFITQYEFLDNIYQFIFDVFDYTRNGILYVPMFLTIGYIINKYPMKLNNKTNILLSILFLILMIIEGMTLYHFDIPYHNSMYIFLIPLSYFLFSLIINNNDGNYLVLRDIATYTYILHPLFIVIVHFISRLIHLPILVQNSLINYLIVVIFTITFIIFIIKVKEYINERKINKK